MSIADVKASRRKFKQRLRAGHAPRKAGRSVSESIEYNRRVAKRMASAGGKKK